MLRNGIILGASNVVAALLRLGRNILIARLISVEDFGIASTFAIVMSLMETIGNIALDRFLVQRLGGVSTTLQATTQSLQALRGAIGAILLFLIAGPLAAVFGVSDKVWAFQTLALIPLMRGLSHLDLFRFQREMLFWPSIKVDLLSTASSTVAAIPLAMLFHDFRVMLYAIVLQQALFTLMSHFVAERSYRWGWDGSTAREAIQFGWPLLLNSILLFLIFHGDRVLVGSLFGMKELGLFSAAFTVALTPTLVINNTLNTFFLPQLSKSQINTNEFHRLYVVTSQAALLSGVLLSVLFAFFGPALIKTLYGAKYESAASLLFWLSMMQAIRIGRVGPAIVATAKADTKNPMIANVIRSLFFPIAWIFIQFGFGIITIITISIFGEIFGFFVSLYLISHRLRIAVQPLIFSIFSFFLVLASSALFTSFSAVKYISIVEFLFLLMSFILFILSMKELISWGRAHGFV
ncbi:oligosaccharide flippase family protein [Mesorhizobium koreense]|uniref:oligosaccharide flippase family protein n=1 Tax=Mesorhizobium koreense TaxID=3074855 RepID=UPI00287B8731|nr:oligosaccharide flippase family protein [Mesorhizobium sp. WR6]